MASSADTYSWYMYIIYVVGGVSKLQTPRQNKIIFCKSIKERGESLLSIPKYVLMSLVNIIMVYIIS